MESMQSPLRMLRRGHTIEFPQSSGGEAQKVAACLSDDDLNDIDEQVQILEFAIDGKFDNRKNKGQVDFSSHDEETKSVAAQQPAAVNGNFLLKKTAMIRG